MDGTLLKAVFCNNCKPQFSFRSSFSQQLVPWPVTLPLKQPEKKSKSGGMFFVFLQAQEWPLLRQTQTLRRELTVPSDEPHWQVIAAMVNLT